MDVRHHPLPCTSLGSARTVTSLHFGTPGARPKVYIQASLHADELPGMAHGNGLTFVTWLMRIGFLAGPALIGLVGQQAGIRWALILIPIAAVLALATSPALAPPRDRPAR